MLVATIRRSLGHAGGVARFLVGLGPRCFRFAFMSLAPRLPLLQRRWLLASGAHEQQLAEQRSYGVDCSCYLTDNIYIKSPVEGHFDFYGVDRFEAEYRELVSSLAPRARDELITRIQSEIARRRGAPAEAAARRRQIQAAYRPLHPSLWTLKEEFLHDEFVSLVRAAEGGGTPALRPLADGVYALPVFSRSFCTQLCEELTHFAASGLPMGRPNSMNNAGGRGSVAPRTPSPDRVRHPLLLRLRCSAAASIRRAARRARAGPRAARTAAAAVARAALRARARARRGGRRGARPPQELRGPIQGAPCRFPPPAGATRDPPPPPATAPPPTPPLPLPTLATLFAC